VRTGSESDRIESLAVAVAKAAPDFDEQQQLIALEVYRRIADGSPAPTEEVAERVRVTPDRVRAVLASWPGVFLDDDQRLSGSGA
jgi:hypothetical protein